MSQTWLSVSDVADHYGVSTRTVRRWISNGLLEANHVGPQILRINESDMIHFVKPVTTGLRMARRLK